MQIDTFDNIKHRSISTLSEAERVDFAKPDISSKEIESVLRVLKSGWLTTGDSNIKFAKEINRFLGSRYCVLTNSCTAALHLSLIAANVKPGDEVITTPFTFVSTVNVILHIGAKPVFVDIKNNDFIIDESKIEEKITKKTKAIIPVHYAGFSANLDVLRYLAKKYRLVLIEDAAHAFGSKYKKEYLGQNSQFCCFSFYPTKNITTGEGGAVIVNDPKQYEQIVELSQHGITKNAANRYQKKGTWKYDVSYIGFKYNMSDIQAALGLAQLSRIQEIQKKRENLYNFYIQELKKVSSLEVLKGNNYSKPIRHLFVIKIKSKHIFRDSFIEKMRGQGIVCGVHFIPVYRFSAYKKLYDFNPKDFPISEKAFRQCVSLPLSSTISEKQALVVVRTIKKVLQYG